MRNSCKKQDEYFLSYEEIKNTYEVLKFDINEGIAGNTYKLKEIQNI